nr:retrovirus-related Pol polyprotein from transposon TNT 1-94 [Tanacetum cinerariifolium]
MCDEFSKIMHDEFKMSMMGELNFFLGLQIKQMEDGTFFNQSTYIKEMLKIFGLEDSKPMKTSMSSDAKLTKDEECESVDSTKYRGIIDEEEEIKVIEKKNLENNIVDETLEIDEIVNIKESRNHLLENVIGNLNQITLRPQAQNKRTKWVFRDKLDENGILSRNKASLEDSKPMKTPMSSDTKLMKDEDYELVDSTKYRGMIGLWYPKGTDIETVVYADSDHARDYVDRKSTSDICTFVGCCLTSWFSMKETALAISTTEAEYVSTVKACQQAL